MSQKIQATKKSAWKQVLCPAVLVAALGYFVDIYDLILFSIVRVPSLQSLGFQGNDLFEKGLLLLNLQMAGMLFGGIFWGILGDKRGRLSVLFGSILMYSVANFANGAVRSVELYALLRFIAGVGLAGELGAGITLVSETLPQAIRGFGTTLVASVGICGALLASGVARHFDWRAAYYFGGALGLALLALRVGVFESGLFEKVKKHEGRRGDFLALFRTSRSFWRYLRCILIGVPIWFVIGILVTFSPEFAQALGVKGSISAGTAVLFCYLGLAIGDVSSGLLSQLWRSRTKVVGLFLLLTLAGVIGFLSLTGLSTESFYALCGLLGVASGYWAIFVTVGAEQFGTNLRATVATTVPNFVRGSVIPLTFFFTLLKGRYGILAGGFGVGLVSLAAALLAVQRMEETFEKDMDYLEPLS